MSSTQASLRALLEARLGKKLVQTPEPEIEMVSVSKETLRYELKCPICTGILTGPKTLLCGHNFCGHCLESLETNKCPMCNKRFLLPRNINTCIESLSNLFFESEKVEEVIEKKLEVEKDELREKMRKELMDEIYDNFIEHRPSESGDIAREMLDIEDESEDEPLIFQKVGDPEQLADNIIQDLNNNRSATDQQMSQELGQCIGSQIKFSSSAAKLKNDDLAEIEPKTALNKYWAMILSYFTFMRSLVFRRETQKEAQKVSKNYANDIVESIFGPSTPRNDYVVNDALNMQYEKFEKLSNKLADVGKRFRNTSSNDSRFSVARLTIGLSLYSYKIGQLYIDMATTVLNVKKIIEVRDAAISYILRNMAYILTTQGLLNIFTYYNAAQLFDGPGQTFFTALVISFMIYGPFLAGLALFGINFLNIILAREYIHKGLYLAIKDDKTAMMPPVSVQSVREPAHLTDFPPILRGEDL